MVIEPNDSILVNTIIESRDAIFEENRFTSISKINDDIPKSSELTKDYGNESIEFRRSKRPKNLKDFGSDFYMYLVERTRYTLSN